METAELQVHLPKSVAEDPVFAKAVERLAEHYQRSFFPEGRPAQLTLDEAESALAPLGEVVGRKLLQDYIDKQSPQPVAAGAACLCCPRCGQLGRSEGKPCRRSVLTRVGRVEVPGTSYYCASCRLAFCSSAPITEHG